MRKHFVSALVIVILFLLPAYAQQTKAALKTTPPAVSSSEAASPGRLPVRRVVLYKNGVGYFEHSARVRGSQDLTIDFTTTQLNDVLKSLTAVDLGDGKVTSVRYNSIAPLDERLKTLRIAVGARTTVADFLAALRGARVEVRSGAARIVGRLLSVENLQRVSDKGATYTVCQVSVVGDDGEVRSFDLNSSTSVRLMEGEVKDDVGRYLSLLASTRGRDVRRMTLSTVGSGEREVFVSYISEVPVWKSTYRIVLPSDAAKKPLLQGWAIVDNTTGEDWKNVQLALVAGAPQSFVQDISQPYYVRRPVIELPKSVMLTPQQYEASLGSGLTDSYYTSPGAVGPGQGGGIAGGAFRSGGMAGLRGTIKDSTGAIIPGAKVTIRNEQSGAYQVATTDASGQYFFTNVQAGNSALFAEKQGFKTAALSNLYVGVGRTNEINMTLEPGIVSETVEVTARPSPVDTSSAAIAASVERKVEDLEAEAKAAPVGDLFEYDLKQKITIGKNQSAMVPIVQSRVEADKVTVWNAENADEQPRRALWLRNTSGLTLDGGTFNVQEGGEFAGEGTVERIHPGERRLLAYAADEGIRIKSLDASEQRPITRVRIAKGVMKTTREQRETVTYIVHNAGASSRSVIIEHPARDEWKLTGAARPEETSKSYYRFRVNVAPQKTEKLMVEEARPEQTEYELTNIDDDDVALFVKEKAVTPEMEQALRRVVAQKAVISAIDSQVRQRNSEIGAIVADQGRLRDNMKALKGSSEEKALIERYTRQLDEQEDRLAALHKEIDDLNQKRASEDAALDKMVMEITMDTTY